MLFLLCYVVVSYILGWWIGFLNSRDMFGFGMFMASPVTVPFLFTMYLFLLLST